ncbi:MAG: FGGY-family carbohydrate kinase [Clostridiales bacterium]|nr:FGGY-family carbohydrate kinase [Clostridiales bacterium]MDO4349740.1 FGGY-family carbohydrate kinase [Eubacteriales bacterium]MDY4007948.1 FGGY-family carbohydrate kinase [Candidatus Limiplasma sp.]
MDYLIAYDLGTGGIKASVFTRDGRSLADAFWQYDTLFPKEKYMEQRPEDWWRGVCVTTRQLLEKTGVPGTSVRALALSGHSLVAVPFDAQGRQLLDTVPIWCDMRAEAQIKPFFQNLSYEDWYLTTGNGDPPETYTILKLMWHKQRQPDMFKKIHTILGSKDYINYRLTGRMCTDPSYASGFGVFNLKKWGYEDRFMEAAGIPRRIFPEIIPSDGVVGTVTPEAARETGLAPGIPVACGAVDNTCMALGSTGLTQGSVYTSLGSSSWIALTSQEPILDVKTRPFVFAHAQKGYYTSAVSIFSAGNSFRWARDNLCRDLKADVDAYDRMNEMAESVPVGSNGVLFNPTLAGGSAQEPSPNLMGGFMGLTLRNTREDLVRAVMEGIAMSLRCALNILKEQAPVSGDMLMCGGGSRSRVWRQIFADVYHMPVLKTNIDQNAASLGAAALAANACGLWQGYDGIASCHKQEDLSLPREEQAARYEGLLAIYQQWTEALATLSDRLAGLH